MSEMKITMRSWLSLAAFIAASCTTLFHSVADDSGPADEHASKHRLVGGLSSVAVPGFCARFLYLIQCADERPTPELSSGHDSAALLLAYRTSPRPTCDAGGEGGRGESPRPAADIRLAAAGGGAEPPVRVWGDCAKGGPLRSPRASLGSGASL